MRLDQIHEKIILISGLMREIIEIEGLRSLKSEIEIELKEDGKVKYYSFRLDSTEESKVNQIVADESGT